MRYNTPVKFIQPSGGNILNVHHVEFEPGVPTQTCIFPTLAELWTIADSDARDLVMQSDITSCVSDGIVNILCGLIENPTGGTDDEVICRAEFDNLSFLKPGDLIKTHNIRTATGLSMELKPYDSTDNVDTTNLIVAVTADNNLDADTWITFQLTQAFIDDLFDQGGDTFAVRLQLSLGGNQDYEITEIEGCFAYLGEPGDRLPSGSLWYRSAEEQVERLAYQGTSGIFQVKTAEGIGYYENTTLQEMNPGPYTVQWDRALFDDEGFTFLSSDSESIILPIQGLYKINYHVQFINNTGGGASDTSLQARFMHNGSGMMGTLMSTYMPIQQNGGECSIACYGMIQADVGDELQVEVDFLGGTLSSVDVSNSYLEVEFIRKGVIIRHEDQF